MAAAEAYWLAVRAFGGSSFEKDQKQLLNGNVNCSKQAVPNRAPYNAYLRGYVRNFKGYAKFS
jgi:hypothetical protein